MLDAYRPEKFPFSMEAGCEPYVYLQAAITRATGESVQAGDARLLSGRARGFDLVCSGIPLEMKKISPVYADIELVAVPLFAGHGFKGWWGDIHDMVLEQADEIITLPSDQTLISHSIFPVRTSGPPPVWLLSPRGPGAGFVQRGRGRSGRLGRAGPGRLRPPEAAAPPWHRRN